MTKPYKAKFRVVLKDRYAQSVGFWGAKYRIVYSEGGDKPIVENIFASKDGYTVLISSKTPVKIRIELFNPSKGYYEIPTYEVSLSEVETSLKENVKTVQIEKGYFKLKIFDPFGKLLDKNHFEYKILAKENDKNGKSLIIKDWSSFNTNGFTDLISTDKGLISLGSSVDNFRSRFYTRPYLDIYLRHKKTKLEIIREERAIAVGSDKLYREWKIDRNALQTFTKPRGNQSTALINELKFSRDIKVLLSLSKGKTYIAKRDDGGVLFNNALKQNSFINWQDGQEVIFKVPARFKGGIIISDKNGKEIEMINIGALDGKIYKSNEKPKTISILKQPLVDGRKSNKQDFNGNEYAQYCIDINYNGPDKKFSLEDMKDPKKCNDKEFKSIWKSIKETFSFDNSATWWNVSVGVATASLDVAKRVSIIDKFFKPFFNVMGVAASQAVFIIKNLGNHNGLFFIGLIRGRAYFHYAKFAANSKDVLTQVLPREVAFDFSPKGTVKGSLAGLIVGGAIEIQKWAKLPTSQKDITDLLANLTGMAVKTIVGTWLGVLIVSLVVGGGPIGVVIGVGVLVGIAIGWALDYFDEKFGFTEGLRDFYNHLQTCTQNTMVEITEKGNKLLGLNYTLPSWLF